MSDTTFSPHTNELDILGMTDSEISSYLKLDQSTPQSMTGLSDGYLKLTGGVIGAGTIDLSGYVPYTGATTNVDLGIRSLTASNISGTNTGDQDLSGYVPTSRTLT